MEQSSKRVKTPQHLWPWWQHAGLALLLLATAYGTASWAIDTGHLLLYAATLALTYLGIRELLRIRIKF